MAGPAARLSAAEVEQLFADAASAALFLDWMIRHRLGRKRLLDTLLAATLHAQGVTHLVTNNRMGFGIFGCFEILDFASPS